MRHSVAKLASISLLGGLIGKGLRYSLSIVVKRGLGPDALGLFAFGLILLKAGSILSQLGLDRAVQKYVPVYIDKNREDKIAGITALSVILPAFVGGCIVFLLYLARPFLVAVVQPQFVDIIRPFALGIPLYAVMMVTAAETKAFRETKYFVYIRDIGQTGFAIVLVGIGAYVLSDLRSVVYGYHLSLLCGIILSSYFLHRLGAVRWTKPSIDFQEVLSFSLPVTIASVSLFLISWTDILMLSAYVTPTQVGWYQISFQTSVLLLLILNACNSVFPTLASELHQGERYDRLERVYTALTKWISSVTFLGYFYILVYGAVVLRIFGTVSPETLTALTILGFGQTITACSGPIGFLLTMTGYERLQTSNALLTAALNITLNWVFIQQFGILGAAIATTLSFSVLNIIRLAEAQYLLGINPFAWAYWRSGFGILAGCIVVLSSSWFLPKTLPIALIVGVATLATFFAVTVLLGPDEYDSVLFDSLGNSAS